MDYEKLVADLRDWLPPESEKIPYGELVGAPYPYNLQGPLVYSDEVCNLVEEAADAITALLDENARLKNRKSMWWKLLRRLKVPLAGGTKERRPLMDIEKLKKDLLENSDPDGPCIEDDLMQDAATALSTLQAENERLRAELEQARAEITRLKHYEDKCHDCPIVCAKTEIIKAHEELEAAQNERNMWKEGMEDCQQSILELEAELEQAKRERDAAVEDLHKLCPAWKWDGQKEG